MFLKGNLHGDGAALIRYMLNAENGEVAEFVEQRGFDFFSADPVAAARLMQEMAEAKSNSTMPFFHGQLRTDPDERLTGAQWIEAIDRYERRVGFTGQPRFVTAHIDPATGEKHFHVAWFRFDAEHECVIDPGLFKVKLREEARFIEQDFGLRQLDNWRQPHDRARAAKRAEFEQSRRLDTDNRTIRTAILERFEQSDSGRAFNAAMQAQGYELTNGDRRNCFVVIDQAGGYHALNKALTGKTLDEIAQRFADIDRAALRNATVVSREREQRAPGRDDQAQTSAPEIAAKARHKGETGGAATATANTRTGGPENGRQRQEKPLGRTAAKIRTAAATGDIAKGIEDAGLILVYASREEAQASQRAHAFAKAAGRQHRVIKEGFGVVDARGTLTRIDARTAGEHWPKVQTQLAGIDRASLLSVAAARAVMVEANRAAWAEQQRIEREKARPASFIEQKIIACDERARLATATPEIDLGTPAEPATKTERAKAFAAALDKAEIAVVRVTAADMQALDALRQDEDRARLAAEVNRESYRQRQFDKVEIGEIAAVDKRGNVHRLNPHRLDLAHIEAQLIAAAQTSSSRTAPSSPATPAPATNPILPGVIAARAAFEIRAEQTAALWDQRRADSRARAAIYAEGREGQRAFHDAVAPVKRGVRGLDSMLFKGARGGLSAATAFLGSVADKIGGLFDFFGGPTAPPTPEQQERNERVAEQQHAEGADLAAYIERSERVDDILRQISKDDAERLRQRRERGDGDEVDRGRERER